MLLIFLAILFLIIAIFGPRFIKDVNKKERSWDHDKSREVAIDKVISMRGARFAARIFCAIVVIVCVSSTSMLWVDSDEVGHLKRIYWAKQMPPGRIIAMPDEMGPQARVLMPGFQFELFIKVLYDVEMLPVMVVEQGQYGFLTARDGKPLDEKTGFMAPPWDDAGDMIDALKFMGWTGDRDTYKGPVGIKGPQVTVIRPGTHRVNRYLFDGDKGNSTPIKTGFVGVVKSNVGEEYTGDPILPTGIQASNLSVPIVPKGYRGIWKDVLKPGEFYLNEKAYVVTHIDTRVQTWKYLGGYNRRIIGLTIGDDGKITQTPDSVEVKIPDDAADGAVILRIEGWDVPQDSRVQVQVSPENAPFVVASVGDLVQIENKIITPTYRSIMRNTVAEDVTITEPKVDAAGVEILDDDGKPVMHQVTRRRKVLDLLYQREQLEQIVTTDLIPAGAKVGLTVQWVRFGDPAVPPELLIPGKRRQLAKQLEATYAQEKIAQVARVNTERERARADQQPELMKSEIGIEVAKNNADAREKEGIGEKKYYTELAKGQAAQRDVLGAELTFQLAALKEVLTAAIEEPKLVKMPSILVQGDGDSLTGAAAILGRSNLNIGGVLNNISKQQPPKQ